MALVFTFPGKIGDALMQWPIVHHYCKQNNVKCEVWLDEKSLQPLGDLFKNQPCVEKVRFIPGIKNYGCGGQPFDFEMDNDVYLNNEVYHLGLRSFPSRQLTLEALEQVPLHLDTGKIASECSLYVPNPVKKKERTILHGNFLSHMSGVPGFWKFLNRVKNELPGQKVFVGTTAELGRAKEVHPTFGKFEDNGSFLNVARIMVSSDLVVACGSSVAALAGALKVPCIRVHDAIGEHPKVIWSNLGPRQWNLTEKELRSEWKNIAAELLQPA
jgi:hypothetical protein